MPKVSVIIPVYNTGRYLKRCLDSVCNQTLSDIEIICINDYSTDNSLEILNKYSLKDKRIKVIDFKKNKGASIARNSGIDEASGEYIGFVDSDDFVDLDFYEKLYRKAKETNADAIKGEMWEINDYSPTPICSASYDLNKFIEKNKAYFYFTFTTAIYKLEFLNKHEIRFPNNLCHLEDPYFTIKAAIYYNNIKIVNNAKYYYVITKDTREKKENDSNIINSISHASNLIIDLLNDANIEKKHYIIVSSFVLGEMLARVDNMELPDEIYNSLLYAIFNFLEKNKYKEYILSSYYDIKRKLFFQNRKNNNFRKLRTKNGF